MKKVEGETTQSKNQHNCMPSGAHHNLPLEEGQGGERGHTLTLTSSGEASMVGPTNSETESNHIGRSEIKTS